MARIKTFAGAIAPAKKEDNLLLGTIPFSGNKFLMDLFEKVHERKEQGLDPNPAFLEEHINIPYGGGGVLNWIFDKFQFEVNGQLLEAVGTVDPIGDYRPMGAASCRTYYQQVLILVDGKISARIRRGWKSSGHSVEIQDHHEFFKDLFDLKESAIKAHSINKDMSTTDLPVYRTGNDLFIEHVPFTVHTWEEFLPTTLEQVLELFWNDLDWSSTPLQGMIVEDDYFSRASILLVGSKTAVAAINKFNSSMLLFINKEEICGVSYSRDKRWFHLKKDLGYWIKGLPEEDNLTKYLYSIKEEGYEKALDSIKELFKCIEKYRKSNCDSSRSNSEFLSTSNQLPTEWLHPETPFSLFSMLKKGTTEKDSWETPFSWGTDMQGKLLVALVAKEFVKENWKDKAVFFRSTFRCEAPDEETFFKGDINIEDVLMDQAPLIQTVEINGESNPWRRTLYTGGGYIYAEVPNFGRVILDNDGPDSHATFKMPHIDWHRTFKVNQDLKLVDLLAGKVYCWLDGDHKSDDQHSLIKTSVWLVDYINSSKKH